VAELEHRHELLRLALVRRFGAICPARAGRIFGPHHQLKEAERFGALQPQAS